LVDRLYILIRTHLWAQILVAMVLGIGTGLMLSPTGLALLDEPSARVVAGWLALPGQVFLALIQMIMIPLVMSSIILGISSSGDPTQLRHLGSRLGPYFLATTLLAVGLGATLVSWLQPGTYLDASVVEGVSRSTAAVPLPEPTADESLPDLIVRLIPTNPLDALMDERMLQVVVLAILLGIALMSIARERAFVIVEFTASVQELAMKVVSWAMLLAPAAVCTGGRLWSPGKALRRCRIRRAPRFVRIRRDRAARADRSPGCLSGDRWDCRSPQSVEIPGGDSKRPAPRVLHVELRRRDASLDEDG
jgi:Na+/H+-dicarboxylate symporter